MNLFAPGLRAWQQAFLNEYLHYYYHRDEALRALLKPETRGEETNGSQANCSNGCARSGDRRRACKPTVR